MEQGLKGGEAHGLYDHCFQLLLLPAEIEALWGEGQLPPFPRLSVIPDGGLCLYLYTERMIVTLVCVAWGW